MPTYSYFCESCSSKFELFAHFKDYIEHPKCVECSSNQTIRSYSDDLCIAFVKKSDSELKTIGDLANRNRDKMSQDQKIELSQKHNEYKEQHSNKELPSGMSRMNKLKVKNKWY
jgi:putative FmdB family regulatory protein